MSEYTEIFADGTSITRPWHQHELDQFEADRLLFEQRQKDIESETKKKDKVRKSALAKIKETTGLTPAEIKELFGE
jgi:chromatin remodeling complex protein RSC6